MACGLEGYVITEHVCRVDSFRRFIERVGSDGKGLVQFYGLAARRSRPLEDRSKPRQPIKPGSSILSHPVSDKPFGPWETTGPKLITVSIGGLKIDRLKK